jgi:thioredoxin-dependent peroxiredoxin
MTRTFSHSISGLFLALAGTTLIVAGCTSFTYKDLPVSKDSANAGSGNTVTFKGSPVKLEGTAIKVGDTLHDAKLATGDLKLVNLTEGKSKVRIISIVPSLDTKVCEQQTHYLSEKNRGLDHDIQLITVSVDTPFAQKRFAEEAKIRNVTFLSDYRSGDFGRAHGLLVTDLHVLARAVIVVDKENVIRYLQVVPELASMPDMDAAFNAARKVAGLQLPLPPMGQMGGFTY